MTATARNSSPLLKCMAPTDTRSRAVFTWSSSSAKGSPAASTAVRDRGLFLGAVEHANRWVRPVEYRDRAAPLLRVAVHVGDMLSQQSVRLRPDLVRCTVVHAQRPRAATDVHAERQPGEGQLEDSLP